MRTPRPLRRFRRTVVGCLGFLATLAGCGNLGYYVRSAQGQMDLSRRARPIQELLDEPGTPPTLRGRLETALKIREFATRQLALPDNQSYRVYADLGRPYAVWNVYAAPELSVQPKEWCFPVAGCVSYRGYYAEGEADRFASQLRTEGFDVYVGGVAAYSTLGWFDDPILNTFIDYPETDLARLIFHELAHQVAYAPDDSTFNESFATAVELEGVKRWLRESAPDEEAAFDAGQQRRKDFRDLVLGCRQRLEQLYASPRTDDEKRRLKKEAFSDLRRDYGELKNSWGGYAGYDGWFAQPLSNAHLASIATYTSLLPAFQQLLARCDGQLAAFYQAVREMVRLPREERLAALARTAAPGLVTGRSLEERPPDGG